MDSSPFPTKLVQILVENAPTPVAVFDKEIRYLLASNSWYKDYKLEGMELTGKPHYEIFPEIGDEWKAIHQRALQGEQLSREEDAFDREDGSIDYISWTVRPWRYSDGEIGGILMLTEVVTERVRNRMALQTREARLRALMQIASEASIDDAIQRALKLGSTELDLPIGIVSHISGEVYRVRNVHAPGFGLSGREDFELGHTYCSLALSRRKPLAIEHMGASDYNKHPCYAQFQLESYIGMVLIVEGEVFGTLNFSSPEAREKEFSQADYQFVELMAKWIGSLLERAKLLDRLEEAISHQREMFAVLGHDLKNQLGMSISLFECLPEVDDGLSTEQQEMFDMISVQFQSTYHLMMDLLEWGRESMAGGTPQLHIESVTLSRLAEQVFESFHTKAKTANIALCLEGDMDSHFFGDFNLLCRIFHNLVGNALDHLSSGDSVTMGLELTEDTCRLSVRDTGKGLSDEDLAVLNQDTVEKLPNLKSGMRSQHSTGFGLMLCRTYAKRHHGKLHFSHNQPQGLCVTLEFSLTPEPAEQNLEEKQTYQIYSI